MANVEMRDTSLYLIIIWGCTFTWAETLKTETKKLLLYLCNRYKMASKGLVVMDWKWILFFKKSKEKCFLIILYFEAMAVTYKINSNLIRILIKRFFIPVETVIEDLKLSMIR